MGKPPRSPVMTKRFCSSPVRGHSYSHRVWYWMPSVQYQLSHGQGAQCLVFPYFAFTQVSQYYQYAVFPSSCASVLWLSKGSRSVCAWTLYKNPLVYCISAVLHGISSATRCLYLVWFFRVNLALLKFSKDVLVY